MIFQQFDNFLTKTLHSIQRKVCFSLNLSCNNLVQIRQVYRSISLLYTMSSNQHTVQQCLHYKILVCTIDLQKALCKGVANANAFLDVTLYKQYQSQTLKRTRKRTDLGLCDLQLLLFSINSKDPCSSQCLQQVPKTLSFLVCSKKLRHSKQDSFIEIVI